MESSHIGIEVNEGFLRGRDFKNMIAYARFSSDNPSVFLLEKLRTVFPDDLKLSYRLNMDLKKTKDAGLDGVLNALFHSWIGKPFDGDDKLKDFLMLKGGYDYLTGKDIAKLYNTSKNKEDASTKALEFLSTKSSDQVMWYNFIRSLEGCKNQVFLGELSKTLRRSLENDIPETVTELANQQLHH
ncbi:hypothetical protein Plhal304r1_c029g0094761 [Plasmopara halstedii]